MRFCGMPLVQVTRRRSGGRDLAEAEVDDAAVGLAELVGLAGADLDGGARAVEVDLVVALGERLESDVEPVILIAASVVEAQETGGAGGDQVEVAVAVEVGGGERGGGDSARARARAQEDAGRSLGENEQTLGAGRGEVEPAVVVGVERQHRVEPAGGNRKISFRGPRLEDAAPVAQEREPRARDGEVGPTVVVEIGDRHGGAARRLRQSVLGGAIDEAALAQVGEDENAALVERYQIRITVAIEIARSQRARAADRHARKRALAHDFERSGERVAQEVETSAVARGGEIEVALLVVVERQHSRVATAGEPEGGALVAETALAVATPEHQAAAGAEQVARAVVVEIEGDERDRRRRRRHRDRLGEAVASEADLERRRRPGDQARQVDPIVAVEIHGHQRAGARPPRPRPWPRAARSAPVVRRSWAAARRRSAPPARPARWW